MCSIVSHTMRSPLALRIGSRDDVPGWILIDGDCVAVHIGQDTSILCLAQTPLLAATLIDHPSPVSLQVKILAQRLCKTAPGKQVLVSTDCVEDDHQLFWQQIMTQVKEKLEEMLSEQAR